MSDIDSFMSGWLDGALEAAKVAGAVGAVVVTILKIGKELSK